MAELDERRALIEQIRAAFAHRAVPSAFVDAGELAKACTADPDVAERRARSPWPSDLAALDATLRMVDAWPPALSVLEDVIDEYHFLTREAYLFLLPHMLIAILESDAQMVRDLEWMLYALAGVHEIHPGIAREASDPEMAAILAFLDHVETSTRFADSAERDRHEIALSRTRWQTDRPPNPSQ